MPLALRVEDVRKQRQTLSGCLFVEPDWFLREAAGVKQPIHAGETMSEYRERLAKRNRVLLLALFTLAAVAIAVGAWVL